MFSEIVLIMSVESYYN